MISSTLLVCQVDWQCSSDEVVFRHWWKMVKIGEQNQRYCK